jgi:hypothetical protein
MVGMLGVGRVWGGERREWEGRDLGRGKSGSREGGEGSWGLGGGGGGGAGGAGGGGGRGGGGGERGELTVDRRVRREKRGARWE